MKKLQVVRQHFKSILRALNIVASSQMYQMPFLSSFIVAGAGVMSVWSNEFGSVTYARTEAVVVHTLWKLFTLESFQRLVVGINTINIVMKLG